MSNGNTHRPLTREQIANSISHPTDLVEVPEWAGEDEEPAHVRVRALPLGDPWYIEYVEGTAPTPQAIAWGVRDLRLNEKQQAEVYKELIAKQDYPSERELHIRTAVAGTILSAIGEDGEPLFEKTQEQIEWFRSRAENYTAALRISARAHELARPETVEQAKKD